MKRLSEAIDDEFLAGWVSMNYGLTEMDFSIDDPNLRSILVDIDKLAQKLERVLDKSYPNWDENIEEVQDLVRNNLKGVV